MRTYEASFYESFFRIVLQILEKKGIARKEFCAQIGLCPKLFSKYVNLKARPSALMLMRICQTLRITNKDLELFL